MYTVDIYVDKSVHFLFAYYTPSVASISVITQDKDFSSPLLSIPPLIVFILVFLQCQSDPVLLQFEVKEKGEERKGM